MKSNKLITIAMFLMYVIIMALLVMLCFFSDSFDKTIDNYMNEYGYPQIVIYSGDNQMIDSSTVDYIESVDGVDIVSPRITIDYFTELSNMRYLKLRYNTVDNQLKFYDVNTNAQITVKKDSVMVPSVFASANNIEVGDTLYVNSVNGKHILTVTNIVSCPETISVKRDSLDNYDDYDFTYVYISEQIGKEINSVSEVYNQILIMGDEDKVINNIRNDYRLSSYSIAGYSNSNIDKQIHNSTDAASAVINYMVIFIALIGTIFTTLFISQIVNKSQKFIGLLRALGYEKNTVVLVFLRYILIVIILSALVGVVIGYFLLRLMLNIYKDYFVMPEIIISGSIIKMILLLLLECLIGVISCILSAKSIANVSPLVAFNGKVNTSNGYVAMPAAFDRSFKDNFTKISMCGIVRNKRRIIITILCNIACITLNLACVEIIIAKQYAFDYTINDRVEYDLIVGFTEENYLNKLNKSDQVNKAEAIYRLSFNNLDERLCVNAFDYNTEMVDIRDCNGMSISIPDKGIILEEGYAARNGYEVGDNINLNGKNVEVKAICREYLFSTSYISHNQLEELGYSGHNAYIVLTSDDARYYEFAHTFEDADYIIYTVNRGQLAQTTMNKLDLPIRMFTIFALLLGFIIVYNINQLSLMERKDEFTTLRLLGTKRSKFVKMLSIESLVEYIPGVILGCPIGITAAFVLEKGMSSPSMHYVMTRPVYVAFIACVLALIYIIAGILMNLRYIRKLV